MAELAIPLAVLGGLYIISNQNKEKEKEGFEANRRYLTNTNNEIKNYPVFYELFKEKTFTYEFCATSKYFEAYFAYRRHTS